MSNNNEKSLVVNSSTEVSNKNSEIEACTADSIFGDEPKSFSLPKMKASVEAQSTQAQADKKKKKPLLAQSSTGVAQNTSAIDEIKKKVKQAAFLNGEKETVEPIYAVTMKCDENVCVAEQNEDVVFYKWVGNHWKSLTKKRAEADALAWLEKEYPTRATSKLASSCASTAATSLLNSRTIPPKDKRIIIPCRNRWLFVDEKGNIENIAPDRNVGITHQINALIGTLDKVYKPGKLPEDTLFYKLLNTSIPNMEDQALLQEWVGSTLLPDTRYQKAMVMEGPGSNGKGVITEVVSALHENVAAVNLEKIDGFGLSELPNASLVVVSETPKKGINEESLKQLIAGDRVVIDIKQRSQFTCKPFAKWLISCNAFPKITDESDGVWRRLIIMKFMNKFSGKDKDTKLAEKIIANEMLHVLDWALIGLQRLLERGENGDFELPEHIKLNTEIEKVNSNNVAAFIDDMYVVYSSKPTMRKDAVFEKYIGYCESRSLIPFGDVQFWKRMTQRFPQMEVIQKREINGKKRYVNLNFDLSLATEDEPPAPF
jgi:putative DNA primase/helicase